MYLLAFVSKKVSAAMSDLVLGLSTFEQALTKVLSNLKQEPAEIDVFYCSLDDCVAKFRVSHSLVPQFKLSTIINVTLGLISQNTNLSDRLRSMSVDKESDHYFFQY